MNNGFLEVATNNRLNNIISRKNERIDDLILRLKFEFVILEQRENHSGFVDFQTSFACIQDLTNLLKHEVSQSEKC